MNKIKTVFNVAGMNCLRDDSYAYICWELEGF